jgi:deoxycytidylate deaminase
MSDDDKNVWLLSLPVVQPTVSPTPTSTPPKNVTASAIDAAIRSPCQKSRRGAVIYSLVPVNHKTRTTRTPYGYILGRGFNGPPGDLPCAGTERCRQICREICVHAEARAVREAVAQRASTGDKLMLTPCDLAHVKVVDRALVPSGGPSCVQCSKEILDAGVDGVWLFHEDGWKRYTADVFHELSLVACGLTFTTAPREGAVDGGLDEQKQEAQGLQLSAPPTR